jgi:hypothetical protein
MCGLPPSGKVGFLVKEWRKRPGPRRCVLPAWLE